MTYNYSSKLFIINKDTNYTLKTLVANQKVVAYQTWLFTTA